MKKLLPLLASCFILTACSNNKDNGTQKEAVQAVSPKDTAAQKPTLSPKDSIAQAEAQAASAKQAKAQELAAPANYLSAVNWKLEQQQTKGATGRKKTEYFFTGSVTSSASYVTFKDFKISLSFNSKTNSVISTSNVVAYDIVRPGGTVKCSIKTRYPSAMSTFSAKVIGATPVN